MDLSFCLIGFDFVDLYFSKFGTFRFLLSDAYSEVLNINGNIYDHHVHEQQNDNIVFLSN